jgi:hypothetical protein
MTSRLLLGPLSPVSSPTFITSDKWAGRLWLAIASEFRTDA